MAVERLKAKSANLAAVAGPVGYHQQQTTKMTDQEKQKPGRPERESARKKAHPCKRLLKIALYLVLIVALLGGGFVGALVFKHHF